MDEDELAGKLSQQLAAARQQKEIIRSYAEGRADIKGLNAKSLEKLEDDDYLIKQYKEFLAMSNLNMCPLIVGSLQDDMTVMAFTDVTDADKDVDDEPKPQPKSKLSAPAAGLQADKEAQRRWRMGHMYTKSKAIIADCLHHGDGYGLVDEDGNMFRLPTMDCVVQTKYLDPWDRVSAYYEMTENNVKIRTMYWLNDNDVVFRSVSKGDEPWETTRSKHSRIPIVPAFTPEGKGIYEDHTATIDRINYMIFSRVVVVDKQAYKELWLKGLPLYVVDDDGELKSIDWSEQMLQGPGSANVLPGDDSDVKETGATDIGPLTSAAFSEIKHLAALTSTPLYILDPSSAQQSAEGADLADKVHRMKVRTMRTGIGECFAEMMSLSFEVTGKKGRTFEVVWAPLEDESLQSRANTAGILKGLLPLRLIWSLVLQLTPDEIQKAEEALREIQVDSTLAAPGGLGDGLKQQLEDEQTQAAGNDLEQTEIESNQFSLARAPEGGGDASDFIITYLQDRGNDAPARDVIIAGGRMGYTETALKTARTRMADRVKYERRNVGGKSVSYWVLVGF